MMHQSWYVLCDAPGYVKDGRDYKCCAMDEVSGSKSSAAKEFKKSGWKRLKGGQWMCPDCVKKEVTT